MPYIQHYIQGTPILYKSLFLFIFFISFLEASSQFYKDKAHQRNLSNDRYWHLLLHMVDEESEIDDPNFFFSPTGKTNAKDELDATLDALLNETRFDNNASACKFPARKAWLQEKLQINDFPDVVCQEYEDTLRRLSPKSATLVFPSAHINSPASMFGHTFLRINSQYKSKLLAYAINYAADANPDTENATVFAIKGLFGGYYGKYSLLPYYEKLKEYRDQEQRDIWEYDLNLNEEEVLAMVRHMWELNGTQSNYYFFTENCSYNMLWLIEVARPSIHLREYFSFDVIPLESVHAANMEGIIKKSEYRPSKRTILLKYEELINAVNIRYVRELASGDRAPSSIIQNTALEEQQKRYILEAAIEFLEYSYSKNKMHKEKYLEIFHALTKTRAELGQGKELHIQTPNNPIDGHRAIRISTAVGYRDNETIAFLGLRPAYHDLQDSNIGFLRGTQIEFANILLSYSQTHKLEIEDATILSIVSLAQRSELFKSISWRMKTGWDRNSLDSNSNFMTTLGAGYSYGNEFAYVYLMADPLFYTGDKFRYGLGGSFGLVVDKSDFMSTNIEATRRIYDNASQQSLLQATQSFRFTQNLQIKFSYDYKEREINEQSSSEQTYKATLNYYF